MPLNINHRKNCQLQTPTEESSTGKNHQLQDATEKDAHHIPYKDLPIPAHSSAHEKPLSSWTLAFLQGLSLKTTPPGIPGWRSGLAPAFGPGPTPGDRGSNPMSGSWCIEPASPSAYVSASLSLSLCDYHKQIKIFKKWQKWKPDTVKNVRDINPQNGNKYLQYIHLKKDLCRVHI